MSDKKELSNKEDWEELEEWAKEKEEEVKDKYGINILDIDVENQVNSKRLKAQKVIGVFFKYTKRAIIIVLTLILIITYIFALCAFGSISEAIESYKSLLPK